MSSQPIERRQEAISVLELLGPMTPFLDRKDVTEVCVNRPGELSVEGASGWQHFHFDALTFDWAYSLAIAVAAYDAKQLSRRAPFLSARLPRGERIQVVIPPACTEGHVAITIRIPRGAAYSMAEHERNGTFSALSQNPDAICPADRELELLRAAGDVRRFFETAVKARKNIAIVGSTGSGKTTFMKSLCAIIDATHRIITVEDTHELELHQPNFVKLFFNEHSGITSSDCIRSCMRMRPDRVLLGELRGGEAFDFLNIMMTGHSGSITSFHAESCALAFERFAILAKASPDALAYDDEKLKRLARIAIDVVAHFERQGNRRVLTELYFDPLAKTEGMSATQWSKRLEASVGR